MAVFAQIVEASSEELERLRELDPPEALAGSFDEMLALREDQITALATLGEALASSDRDAAGEALLASSRLDGEINLIQQELGLEVCGLESVQEVPNQQRIPENG